MSEMSGKSRGADEDELPLTRPVHPLPEEIQKMKRDETVCRYCGISYLIHNEIKALENKLWAVQNELESYRGKEDREKKLQKDLNQSQMSSKELQKRVDSLSLEVSEKEREIESWICHEKELESQLRTMNESLIASRSKHNRIAEKIPKLNRDLAVHRELLAALKADAEAVRSTLMDELQRVSVQLTDLCRAPTKENLDLKLIVELLQKEKSDFLAQLTEAKSSLEEKDDLLRSLQHVEPELNELRAVCNRLQAEISDANINYTDVMQRNRQLTSETETVNEQIRQLNVMAESMKSQMADERQTSQQLLTDLKKELNAKEVDINNLKEDITFLREKMHQYQKSSEEIARNESISAGRTEELFKSLDAAKSDLQALIKEREMMISAHHDQIEDLRNSFRQKLADAEMWPRKVDEALKHEKEKHTTEMNMLEKKLQENFVLEMVIEKQKNQQVIDRLTAEGKDKESKLRNQLNEARSQMQSHQTRLKAQLAEAQSQFEKKELQLGDEITSLKKVIHDLELRLAKVDDGNENRMMKLQAEVAAIQNHLSQAEIDRNSLEKQLQSAREEVGFLYDTVRRECEERNELTEALSQAREELLACKRLGRGYSAQNYPTGNQGGVSSRNAHSSASVPSNLSQSKITPGPPLLSSTLNLASAGDASSAQRSSVAPHPPLPAVKDFLRPDDTPTQHSNSILPSSLVLEHDVSRWNSKSPGRLRGSVLLESRKRLVPVHGKK